MAENKTKETNASVAAFLKRVTPEERREDCQTVLEMMKQATRSEPKMWGTSIVGFGNYHYKYASGREGDMCLTGFSPRKQDLTLYLMGAFDEREGLLAKLGKHKTGKVCVYIKRLADVDLKVLKQLISASVKSMKAAHG